MRYGEAGVNARPGFLVSTARNGVEQQGWVFRYRGWGMVESLVTVAAAGGWTKMLGEVDWYVEDAVVEVVEGVDCGLTCQSLC